MHKHNWIPYNNERNETKKNYPSIRICNTCGEREILRAFWSGTKPSCVLTEIDDKGKIVPKQIKVTIPAIWVKLDHPTYGTESLYIVEEKETEETSGVIAEDANIEPVEKPVEKPENKS